jgi:predicted acyltransferase
VKRVRRWAKFFAVVGTNSLTIYLFTNTGGANWLRGMVKPFTLGFFGWTGEWTAQVITSLVIWALLWSLCYWLYRRKIFIRI